jgi:hypothetical protein
MRPLIITSLFLLVVVSALTAQVKVISISPSQTDTLVKSIHGDHMVLINTAVKPLNKLVLMIVGTGAPAKDNLPFDSFAASAGYHVISLDYDNTVITTACSNSDDSACFNGFRQEIVFGEPVSALVAVDSINSIYHRFYALLLYLSKKYPRQGWQQYINNDSIQWQKIIVAGHSQGAGHAAYLGKKFPVNRVLIFAGPQDYLAHFNSPASWLSEKGITHPSKYFAFLHLKDPFDFNKQLAGCLKLMQAATADTLLVQPGVAVTKNKHILVTNIESANPHGSMLQPVFKKAWAYLLAADPVKGSSL